MKHNALILIRGVILMGSLGLAIVTMGLGLDVLRAGFPLASLDQFNYTTARFVTDMTNRGLNQVMATVFSVVAIAVPLTANLYSLKFLEFFIKDRVNSFMLTLVVCSDLASFWAIYAIKENAVPVVHMHLAFGLLMLCLALLFPYLYYVFRFLHPNTLLVRLEAEVESALRAARRSPASAVAQRKVVAEALEHISNMAIRSVDRTDRNTAIESVFTLERLGRFYWTLKDQLPPAWFVAEQSFFLGFSSAAVDEFSASRSWVEMKLFSQYRQIMSAAVPRMHDVVDSTAKALRKLGLEATARRDPALRELVMEYFNTFIRLALQRKDPRSVFTLFDHYRLYAEALNAEFPDFVLEIAYYFEHYAGAARDQHMPFLVEAIAHDLGTLVRRAWEASAPNRQKLLERLLHYDAASDAPMPGVKKAQALLASYFLLTGQREPAALIRCDFAGLKPAFVHRLQDDLLHIKREKYWEVNERRMNMDWAPEPQREKLSEFLASVLVEAA